jgi:hypothetical protein
MTAWWRRNRRWLALIVPLLLLALAASSFRLVTLYLPWEWSRPTVADATAGTLRQHFTGFDGERRLREVRVEVVDVETHESYAEAKAADGGVLWRVVLELEADPEQYLRSGQVPAEEGAYFVPPILVPCVPEDAPGPTLNPLTGEPSPSPVTRPRAWREQVLIAMPRDVTPTALRIGWSRPEYLVLRLPVT